MTHHRAAPELPCHSGAKKGLSMSWFVLFFSYGSLIFSTRLKFLSIYLIFAVKKSS